MASITVVPAPNAPLGRTDLTRRWALVFPDGRVRFPGVTRPEGERAAGWLATVPSRSWGDALIEVALPAVLSDGAGPYLVAADGRLVLVIGAHPRVLGVSVAMGPAAGGNEVGAVRRAAAGGWCWLVRAEVPGDRRVAALDALDAARSEAELRDWPARWG